MFKYKLINDRFDMRADELHRLGFVYETIPDYGISVFSRTRFGKRDTIAAGTVLYADSYFWRRIIKDHQTR